MSEIERYIAPSDLAEAVKNLTESGVTIVAGGTDLTPQVNEGRRHYAPTLMNISRVDGLKDISHEKGEIKIGCLVTVSMIKESELLREAAPLLCEAASHFASDQIRNAATIGGNICNASPAGDMPIPLLVLGASVEIASHQNGEVHIRREALTDFFTGPGKSTLQDNELLIAVVFDKPSPDFVGHFRKSGPRPALEISIVSLGIGGDFKAGKFENVRVAMGAVGPTSLRGTATEAALEGRTLDDATLKSAVEAAKKDATPIDDIRSSAWYRTHLIAVFTEELLNNVRKG